MKINCFTLIAFVFILFTSCKKEPWGKCENFPYSSSVYGYSYTRLGTSYQCLDFNPLNHDQFCGTRLYEGHNELFTYDLVTQELTVIAQDFFFGYPFWSRNGWILLNGMDWNVYMIRPNGDSLTQVTFTNHCLKPCWNYDGSRIIYRDNSNPIPKYVSLDPISGTKHMIHEDFLSSNANWSIYPETVIGFAFDYFFRYNLLNSQKDTLDINISPNTYMTYTVLDSSQIVLCYDDKVELLNYETGTAKRILINCDARRYSGARFDRKNAKLYFFKMEKELVEDNLIQVKQGIVRMNLDGSGEEPVMLP